MRRKARVVASAPLWWRRGLTVGIAILTMLALLSMTRVRGPLWVVAPVGFSLAGCLLYRWTRHQLFVGVEVVLVIAYFVIIAFITPYLEPSRRPPSTLGVLSILGLVILYPAQMALWTGPRTLQELLLLGLVAISQFLYGMTLARPAAWWLAVAFFPALVFTLLQYALAREIETIGARPARPRGHAWRQMGLALVLVPFLGFLGGAVFYLLPRYSTISGAFDLLSGVSLDMEPGPIPETTEDDRTTTMRTGPAQRMDLRAEGVIHLDPTALLSVRVQLEALAGGQELSPEYGGRLYLRRQVLDDYLPASWAASGSHFPRTHQPDNRGWVQLPGAPPRRQTGFRITVHPLHRMGRQGVVALGRPCAVESDRHLIGHPEESLGFARRLPRGRAYTVTGEMIYAWPQVKAFVKRQGLRAVHEEMDHYTYVPPRPREAEVRTLAEAWARGASDDVDRVEAVLRRFRGREFTYTLNLPKVVFAANPTWDFLCRSRRGHCERFADGLAALLRHLGLPARVVGGFVGGEWRDRYPAGFVFLARDAHAWVEVHFDRLGWVAVDPSPRGWSANLGLMPPYPALLEPPEGGNDENRLALGPEGFTGREQLGLYQLLVERFRAVVAAVGWPVLVLGLLGLMAMVYFARRVFGDRAREPDGSAAIQAPRLFNPILDLFEALRIRGIRPGRGETPLELATRAGARLEIELVPVMERLYAHRFGGLSFSPDEQDTFRHWLETVRRPPPDPGREGAGGT